MPGLDVTLALIVLSFVLMGAGFSLRNQRPGIALLALGIVRLIAQLSPQRCAAAWSLARPSTQRAPSAVFSFFQNGARVFR